MKTAFITGACGQIGSYLSELLLQDNYQVYGLQHKDAPAIPSYLNAILENPNFKLVIGDITDQQMISSFIANHQPNLFINCAAQSNVRESFESPEYTKKATGDSVTTCLEAIRQHSLDTRFITLGSSEMFGKSPSPQNELSTFDPQSPYAEAKLMGYRATANYRKVYGLFACNAICFNSESPRRPEVYVTKKISTAAVRIKLGLQDKLVLGDLKSVRDFSHAQDTARAIYKIITARSPDDFVVASGKMHSVQDFVERAFNKLQLNWQDYVVIDPKFFRSTPPNVFCGNNSKLINTLNWKPKYTFEQLVDEMVEYDLKEMK